MPETTPPPASAPSPPPSPLRYWGSRLALATASPLIFLALIELAVTALWGPIYYPLPGIEEAAEYLYFTLPERFNPLFQFGKDEQGEGVFATDPKLYETNWFFARKQSFPADRAPDSLRVAFLGGSSVQGWPYREDGIVFAELAGRELDEALPDWQVHTINAGVGTYSSFQLVDVADQLSVFRPDLAVIYTGHNDQGYYFFHTSFLESLAPKSSILHWLNQFNFYQGLRLLRDQHLSKPTLPQTQHENHEGVAFVPQDERIQEVGEERYVEFVRIQQHYLSEILSTNVKEVVERLRAGGTRPILALPAANLRDFPPHFSMHFEPLSSGASKRFDSLVGGAEEAMRTAGVGPRKMPSIEGSGENMRADLPWGAEEPHDALPLGSSEAQEACREPLSLLARAEALSDSYAQVHYLKGLCLLHSDEKAAYAALARARDLSPAMAPHQRASAELRQAIRLVGEEMGVPVIDIQDVLDQRSPRGVADGTWFVDNLHFSAEGHRAVARALVPALVNEAKSIAPDRPKAPSGKEAWAALQKKSKEFTWGLGLVISGAGMAPVGEDDMGEPPAEEGAAKEESPSGGGGDVAPAP